jgi:hypothetical protein
MHRETAGPEARKMVTSMQTKGDPEGADLWLPIIVGLEAMSRAEQFRSCASVEVASLIAGNPAGWGYRFEVW